MAGALRWAEHRELVVAALRSEVPWGLWFQQVITLCLKGLGSPQTCGAQVRVFRPVHCNDGVYGLSDILMAEGILQLVRPPRLPKLTVPYFEVVWTPQSKRTCISSSINRMSNSFEPYRGLALARVQRAAC